MYREDTLRQGKNSAALCAALLEKWVFALTDYILRPMTGDILTRNYPPQSWCVGPMTTLPPLTRETIWAILNNDLDDDTVNHLVWQRLGYRYDVDQQCWSASEVSSDWRDTYPEPPNFIESRPATVKLTRSIPPENKQLLKEALGFTGYKVGELVPRLTRRATMANWLLSYMQQTGLPLS